MVESMEGAVDYKPTELRRLRDPAILCKAVHGPWSVRVLVAQVRDRLSWHVITATLFKLPQAGIENIVVSALVRI